MYVCDQDMWKRRDTWSQLCAKSVIKPRKIPPFSLEWWPANPVIPQELLADGNVPQSEEENAFPGTIQKFQRNSLRPHIVFAAGMVHPPPISLLVWVAVTGELLGIDAERLATLALKEEQVWRLPGEGLQPPLPFLLGDHFTVVVTHDLVPLELHGGNDPCTKVNERAIEQTASIFTKLKQDYNCVQKVGSQNCDTPLPFPSKLLMASPFHFCWTTEAMITGSFSAADGSWQGTHASRTLSTEGTLVVHAFSLAMARWMWDARGFWLVLPVDCSGGQDLGEF